jgi:hypothetical protein
MTKVNVRTENCINRKYVSGNDVYIDIDEAATILGAAANRYGRPKITEGVGSDGIEWVWADYPAWKEEPDGYGRTYRSHVSIAVRGATAKQLRDQYKIGR